MKYLVLKGEEEGMENEEGMEYEGMEYDEEMEEEVENDEEIENEEGMENDGEIDNEETRAVEFRTDVSGYRLEYPRHPTHKVIRAHTMGRSDQHLQYPC